MGALLENPETISTVDSDWLTKQTSFLEPSSRFFQEKLEAAGISLRQ